MLPPNQENESLFLRPALCPALFCQQDEAGRAAILRVHCRKLTLGPDVDLNVVAQITPSASGAELAAVVNEAAIRAVRRGGEFVIQQDFTDAVRMFRDARGGEIGASVGKIIKDAFNV